MRVEGQPVQMDVMYAWVAMDLDGSGEGIAGFTEPTGRLVPLVCSSPALAQRMRPIAQDLATASGKIVRLVRFGSREDLEVLEP